jgi:CO/xanthine dehydrogenase Mo-binding subunit
VGKAINPQLVEGQIEGGVAQAVGWATCENFIVEGGRVMTPHLSTYLIPTIADVPERVQSVSVERPDPRGPWGARGMGEMPLIPLAPALVAAVHDATGVWFDELPLTPERVLRGLGAGKLGNPARQTPTDQCTNLPIYQSTTTRSKTTCSTHPTASSSPS